MWSYNYSFVVFRSGHTDLTGRMKRQLTPKSLLSVTIVTNVTIKMDTQVINVNDDCCPENWENVVSLLQTIKQTTMEEMTKNSTEVLEISDYLAQFAEVMPEWIKNYKPGDTVRFNDVMASRIGYYPGCGNDGHLMKVCNRAHCVHSYIYVDYGIDREGMLSQVTGGDGIRGYKPIGIIDWKESDLLPNGQFPLNVEFTPRCAPDTFGHEKPYCCTVILQREEGFGEDWGAERFAVTFLCADGIATYYQLFCRQYKKAPWIFLLQDHGFGCNYDSFGKGGMLDRIMLANGIRPEFVLCGGTRIWNGYECVENVALTRGGMHSSERYLYSKKVL